MRYRCQSCNGVYDATNPDGTAYYHVCPDLGDYRDRENARSAGHRLSHRDENVKDQREQGREELRDGSR